MAKEKDILLDHNYDGIHELDNDLPPWWLYLFYITIIFAVVYVLHYHVFQTGDLSLVEYQREMNPNWVEPASVHEGLLYSYNSPFANPEGDVTPRVRQQFHNYIGPDVPGEALIIEAMRRTDSEQLEKLKTAFPDLFEKMNAGGGAIAVKPAAGADKEIAIEDLPDIEPLTDAAGLAAGKEIFAKNCVSCHGPQGGGGIGPNLTDDYWIHGGQFKQIVHTIHVGVPAKGMIAWRAVLKEDEIHQVASYIHTLHGTNPPNGKKPQGELVEYPQ